jgi:hypothetical protein
MISLGERFEQVKDHQHRRGVRHSLPAILRLVAAATAAGHSTLQAIAQYGRGLTKSEYEKLGFKRPTPTKSTLSLVLGKMHPEGYLAILTTVAASHRQEGEVAADAASAEALPKQLALDGKCLRGSGDDQTQGDRRQHVVSLDDVNAKVTLDQAELGSTNEHKVALALLARAAERRGLAGTMVTGDAMFTHQDLCRTIQEAGGGYVLPVRDNQPGLRSTVTDAFVAPDGGFSPLSTASARKAPSQGRLAERGP